LIAGFDFSSAQRARYDTHCLRKTRTYVLHPAVQASIGEIAAKLSKDLEISRAEMDKILLRHDLGPKRT